MTALAEILRRQIRETGPLTVAEFMSLCLGHPDHGYYTTRDPLGAAGDFTTAPEISQMFGELIGLALAQAWLDRGSPRPVRLVELGPGRGTLMADMLRAMARVPAFREAVTIHLVETSPVLRQRQHEIIAADITHHDAIGDVPDGPLFLVANEFFDALPVRQFVRAGPAWRERLVGLADGALSFGLSDPTRPAFLDTRLDDATEGDIVEVSLPGRSISAEIGGRISASGGVAYLVDYGDWRSLGDTLQALRGHRRADPLEAPGEADLTAHVDFEALAAAARPAAHSRLTPQGVFLERLGIADRARALARGLSGARLDAHVAAHRRLTHPDEMGTLFKVMALFDSDGPPPGVLT